MYKHYKQCTFTHVTNLRTEQCAAYVCYPENRAVCCICVLS
uniref:Uncharacterized protein n=1 Tax=Anguilla anguilla TaxID=7936 RepID=A0A0E9VFB4_ANGAN